MSGVFALFEAATNCFNSPEATAKPYNATIMKRKGKEKRKRIAETLRQVQESYLKGVTGVSRGYL